MGFLDKINYSMIVVVVKMGFLDKINYSMIVILDNDRACVVVR